MRALGLGLLLVLSGNLCASDKSGKAPLPKTVFRIRLPDWLLAKKYKDPDEDEDWANAIWPHAPAGHQEGACSSPLPPPGLAKEQQQREGEIKNPRRRRGAPPRWPSIDRQGVLERHPSVKNLLLQHRVHLLVDKQACSAPLEETENEK